MARGTIDERFIDEVRNLLLQQLDDKEQLAKWFARFMTTRKYPDLELDTDLHDEAEEDRPLFEELERDTVLCRHPASRFAALAGDPANLAVDGELYPCTPTFATTLADTRRFELAELGILDHREKALIDTLLRNGSLALHI
jgi:ribosomal protein L16 Arg81 hydroxylase